MLLSLVFMMLSGCAALRATASYTVDKPIMRGVRVYGGTNEMSPPIIVRAATALSPFGANSGTAVNTRPFVQSSSNQNTSNPNNGETFGASFVTVEIDVQTQNFPAFVVTFVHCDALWHEDDKNIIINTPMLRTTQVDVRQASSLSKYYTHRATFTAPNSDVKLTVSGNWKAKVFEANDLTTAIAEARFFLVEQVGHTSLGLLSDVYRPRIGGTSPSAYILEASIQAPPEYIDDYFQTVIFYRNNRWHEPRIVTQNPALSRAEILYNNSATTTVTGFSVAQKRFRIAGIPAEHEYRVLDLTNPAFAPASTSALRFARADLRRNGVIQQNFDGSPMLADDGFLTTRGIAFSNDEYVFLEFILDPEQAPSSGELFVVGSFNEWKASPTWKMEYDTSDRLYKLRQWVRRGRHNYMYATGRINTATNAVEDISFEECEGNTFSTNQTFFALFYYKNPTSGGYDALYGAAAANARRRTR